MKTTDKPIIQQGYRKRQETYYLAASALFLLVVLLGIFMMIYGNTIYTPSEIYLALSDQGAKGTVFIIKTLRLPRMLCGFLCGAAFGLSGNTFQKLLGNPLASPDIIGITSGASVAAVFGILILHLDGSTVSLLAILSGMLVSAVIYFLSQGNGFSNERLILTGIGMQAFLNALISWMLLKASEYDVSSALRWLSGSLNGVTMNQASRLAITVCVASGAMFLLNRHLEILQLGESHATILGVKMTIVRLLLIVLSLILIASATSVTGPIASAAFLSGPIAARLSGGGHSHMLTSALTGSALVMLSDLIGQYAFPSRYPVGVITGILGAPYLIWLLLRMNKKGESIK